MTASYPSGLSRGNGNNKNDTALIRLLCLLEMISLILLFSDKENSGKKALLLV
jgi:hypothetical protein